MTFKMTDEQQASSERGQTIRAINNAELAQAAGDHVFAHQQMCHAIITNGYLAEILLKSEQDQTERERLLRDAAMSRRAEDAQYVPTDEIYPEYRDKFTKEGTIQLRHELAYDKDWEAAAERAINKIRPMFEEVRERWIPHVKEHYAARPDTLTRLEVRSAAWSAARKSGLSRREAGQAAASATVRVPVDARP